MTLGEAIRQMWPKVRATTPLPTTVAEVRALRDSGFGCPVDDQHMIHVTFHGRTVHVTLIDPVTRECDGGEFTAREFLELIAEPAQRSLFAEAHR